VTERPAIRPLPIFCGDACSSVFGVMLWPDDLSRAERFAAYHLTRGRDGREPRSPFLAYGVAGHDEFTGSLASALARGDMSDRDVEARCLRGLRAGEVVKTLWALICSQPAVASWDAAIQVVEDATIGAGHRIGRSRLRDDLSLLRARTPLVGRLRPAGPRVQCRPGGRIRARRRPRGVRGGSRSAAPGALSLARPARSA
jgi:hypothetical protein